MNIKASGRSALILATGLFVCFAGPSQAAEGADNATPAATSESAPGAPIKLSKYTKHSSRSTKKVAPKSGKELVKPSADNKPAATDVKPAATDVAADGADSSTSMSTSMPPWVANANAKFASVDTPTGSAAKAMSARANDILQATPENSANADSAADSQVVAADQLNDLDRALQESAPQESKPPPRATLALASAEPPAAPVVASSNESTTLDQTSLIGKIFIAFGGLLTLASAARMFMA